MIRVGVIGIGFGQQAHVPAFRRNSRCRVEGICASSTRRARVVADRLGIPKAYGDWRELVADRDIDIVTIATPPAVQPDIALAALKYGKPVFCEKPLATSPLAAAAMLDAARREGLPHMVDFGFVAIDEWIQAREMIQAGLLGRLRHVSIGWHTETYAVRKGLRNWKTEGVESGGGVLNTFVSMVFHYVEWLLGRVARLTAEVFSTRVADSIDAETQAVLCLELEGGASVAVSVSNTAFVGTGHRVEIYGDEGALILDNTGSLGLAVFRVLRGNRESGAFECVAPAADVKDGRIPALATLADRFITWIESGVPAAPSFEDGYRVQCLLEYARQSHATGRWIDTPPCDGAFGARAEER